MICIVSCSLSLLVIASGMFLLAKTKKEELGNFFKWMSYLIILGGFLTMLACLCCCCRMHCRMGCGPNKMECHEGMQGGMHGGMECMPPGGCPHMGACCKEGMKECEHGAGMMEKKGCCKGHEEGEKEEGGKADSSNTKK